MSLEALKARVRSIATKYADREERSRRIFMEERAAALFNEREREFEIKSAISNFLEIPYSAVSFCGSAQIGFSVHKDTLFQPAASDLDVACISSDLFQRAWIDIVQSSRSFSDLTVFVGQSIEDVERFKEQIIKRGMIRVDSMPNSNLYRHWVSFQEGLGRQHRSLFRRITIAIYMNEYAFCWKQDSAIKGLLE